MADNKMATRESPDRRDSRASHAPLFSTLMTRVIEAFLLGNQSGRPQVGTPAVPINDSNRSRWPPCYGLTDLYKDDSS
jgi:hypothetical protein